MREIELQNNFFEDSVKITSIYFGGGTPSLLHDNDIIRIFEAIYKNFSIVSTAEVTFEVNPEDVSVVQLDFWKNAGINRLSLGLQSFVDEDLVYMNRLHNVAQAKNALHLVAERFQNYSTDLIFGSPHLNHDQLEKNIQFLLSYNVPHISAYALTIEPKTALHSKIKNQKVLGPNDEDVSQQFDIVQNHLNDAGYSHYEISNYCLPNKRAIHNSSYWQRQSYLGLGPGAHSFRNNVRHWNIANNVKYIKSMMQDILPNDQEVLRREDIVNEEILTGLRTIEGFDLNCIKMTLPDFNMAQFMATVEAYIQDGLLRQSESILLLTQKGKHFADGIASALFITES